MLTENQERFLYSLPPEKLNRLVKIEAWESKDLEFAEKEVEKIRAAVPKLKVVLMGSMALKIAGEKDIDITIYCPKVLGL